MDAQALRVSIDANWIEEVDGVDAAVSARLPTYEKDADGDPTGLATFGAVAEQCAAWLERLRGREQVVVRGTVARGQTVVGAAVLFADSWIAYTDDADDPERQAVETICRQAIEKAQQARSAAREKQKGTTDPNEI